MKHTEGPWRWEQPVETYSEWQLYAPESDTVVLSIYMSHGGGEMPNEADARLIAAAPELRSALREALDGWADAAQYKDVFLLAKHGDMEDIARFRALLASIEGEK